MKPIELGPAPRASGRRVFALCVLTIFSTLARAPGSAAREIRVRDYGDQSPALPSGVFRFDRDARLRDILDQRPDSVEGFLALVPEFVRQNHTLISQSASIQYASLVDPRAIMATPTANLVITFAGHADVSGGRAIEAMEFNTDADAYDFHEITWARGRAVDVRNPRKCTACHTAANMPNWRPYNDWRESYATINDHFGSARAYVTGRFGRPDTGLIPNGAHVAEFKQFVATKSTNGDRYKYLTAPAAFTGGASWPFGSFEDMKSYGFNYFDIEPNRRLGVGLIFHWSRALGARISRSALFKIQPANLIANLLECDGRDPEFARGLETAAETRGLSPQRAFEIPSLKAPLPGAFNLGPDVNELYRFLNALAVADVAPESWVTNYVVRDAHLRVENLLGPGELSSFSGFEEMNEVPRLTGLYLVGALGRRDASFDVPPDQADGQIANAVGVPTAMLTELAKIIPLYDEKSIRTRVCPKLIARARTETAPSAGLSLETSPALRARLAEWSAGRPYVIQRCAACHDQGAYQGAPHIAFEHPDELRAQLRADGGALLENIRARTAWTAPDELRMPKGAYAMPRAQRRELLRYLVRIQRAG